LQIVRHCFNMYSCVALGAMVQSRVIKKQFIF